MRLVHVIPFAFLAGLVAAAQGPSFSSLRPVATPAKSATVALASSGTTSTLVLPPLNDDCFAAQPLVGAGPFAFDTTTATTGTQGQSTANCSSFSSTTIEHDVWFCWTAPATGSFDASTIGLTTVDTRLAVYSGCACPTPTSVALACNDDACGTLQSRVTFNATVGSSYLVQLGSFPGANGGVGQFDIAPTSTIVGCTLDDGSAENSIGLTSGGNFCWMQRFGATGARTLVSEISSSYGSPLFPTGAPPIGTPVDVLVWDDPNDDGVPADCTLVFQGTGVVTAAGLGGFDVYPVAPSLLQGVFFVGVALAHSVGQFPAALDGSGCDTTQPAWAFGSSIAPLDFQVLTNNQFPPLNASSLFGGVWLLRAGCASSSGTSFCGNADPLRIPCPCGNNGTDALAGCANSVNATGAKLATSGFTLTDDVVLQATRMSGQVSIYFRTLGPAASAGAVFGDGVTCTGGSLLRLGNVTFALGSGASQFPPPATTPLSTRSGTAPGSGVSMAYAAFYRNAASFCTPLTFNVTSTVQLDW